MSSSSVFAGRTEPRLHRCMFALPVRAHVEQQVLAAAEPKDSGYLTAVQGDLGR